MTSFKDMLLREHDFGAVGNLTDIIRSYEVRSTTTIRNGLGSVTTTYRLRRMHHSPHKSFHGYALVKVVHAAGGTDLNDCVDADVQQIIESSEMISYQLSTRPEEWGYAEREHASFRTVPSASQPLNMVVVLIRNINHYANDVVMPLENNRL